MTGGFQLSLHAANANSQRTVFTNENYDQHVAIFFTMVDFTKWAKIFCLTLVKLTKPYSGQGLKTFKRRI